MMTAVMPPEQSQNQYEFIMNPGQAPRRGLLGGSKPSPRLLLLAGGAVVALIIVVVIIGSLLGGSKGDSKVLIGLAEQQAEIARVAQLGTQNATSQDAQNFAANVNLSLTSSEQQMVQYLKLNGVKVGAKTLLLKHDAKTDAALAAAKSSGTYDSTFVSLMQTELTAYQSSLNTAYKAAAGKTEKKVLSDAFAGAGLLLQQSKQHS